LTILAWRLACANTPYFLYHVINTSSNQGSQSLYLASALRAGWPLRGWSILIGLSSYLLRRRLDTPQLRVHIGLVLCRRRNLIYQAVDGQRK
jgi:hypothetical protein